MAATVLVRRGGFLLVVPLLAAACYWLDYELAIADWPTNGCQQENVATEMPELETLRAALESARDGQNDKSIDRAIAFVVGDRMVGHRKRMGGMIYGEGLR